MKSVSPLASCPFLLILSNCVSPYAGHWIAEPQDVKNLYPWKGEPFKVLISYDDFFFEGYLSHYLVLEPDGDWYFNRHSGDEWSVEPTKDSDDYKLLTLRPYHPYGHLVYVTVSGDSLRISKGPHLWPSESATLRRVVRYRTRDDLSHESVR